MPTHDGTSKGACCMFPFIYQGNPQHRCTRAKRRFRWCATTANYDTDKQWGYCASCFLCHGGNSNGNCCHFPFTYGGKMYTTCTTQDETKPWCATTYNYDVDKLWGYCGGEETSLVITTYQSREKSLRKNLRLRLCRIDLAIARSI